MESRELSEQLISQARQSFERRLENERYTNIIKDDRHLKLLMSMVELDDREKALDIGTGTGYLAFPLAGKNPLAEVIGIDIAEHIIEKDNAIVQEHGLSNIRFMAFNGIDYPFEDYTFDVVVTRYAMHHFPQIDNTIERIARLLKKGGHLLVSDPMKHENDKRGIIDWFMNIREDGHIGFYMQSELNKMFEEHGFVMENQVITSLEFPFSRKPEYFDLYAKLTQRERNMYGIEIRDEIVWIGNIEVGNTLFMKRD